MRTRTRQQAPARPEASCLAGNIGLAKSKIHTSSKSQTYRPKPTQNRPNRPRPARDKHVEIGHGAVRSAGNCSTAWPPRGTSALREGGFVGREPLRLDLTFRATRAGIGPGFDQLAELRLATRRRSAVSAGVPAPADQVVFGHVVHQRRHVLAAIAALV